MKKKAKSFVGIIEFYRGCGNSSYSFVIAGNNRETITFDSPEGLARYIILNFGPDIWKKITLRPPQQIQKSVSDFDTWREICHEMNNLHKYRFKKALKKYIKEKI